MKTARFFYGFIFVLLLTGCSKSSEGTANGSLALSCDLPAEAQEELLLAPDEIIGDGTPQSCTSAAVVGAVARGGVITFNCGPNPIEIVLQTTAKVFNNARRRIVIDGGNKVTLSGGGARRILYMNTCDPNQVWTTSHCQDQDHPQLTVQNITFKNGNSKGETTYDGGGAIWVRGGRFKIINTRFESNVCADTGPDVGGGAVRVFDQFQDKPVYIVNTVFGGSPTSGNVCSNGGALSSIGVSFAVVNSSFTHNRAIGVGANPARSGTPGGGSGGAIYNDGNFFQLNVCNTRIENNSAKEGGGAIFFVSNNRTGLLRIEDSLLKQNPNDGFQTQGFPGIFYLGVSAQPQVFNSTVE